LLRITHGVSVVILGLVPRIQASANAGADCWLDGRDKPDHDKRLATRGVFASLDTICEVGAI
jgi:hypothetical protein